MCPQVVSGAREQKVEGRNGKDKCGLGDSKETCRTRTKQMTGERGRGDKDGAKASRASWTPVCQGTALGLQQTPLLRFNVNQC